MRVRTDAKRQEIIIVAAELFLERGYQRTSMSLISQRLGGSKTTLYGYFESKEELLLAVLEDEVANTTRQVFSEAFDDDPRESLRRMGLRYLKERLGNRHARLFRIMTSLPEESSVGLAFHQQAIIPANRRTASQMERLIEGGVLRPDDPWMMALHFKGLLEQDFVERTLLAPQAKIGLDEIEIAAWRAADAFLSAYRREKTKSEERKAVTLDEQATGV